MAAMPLDADTSVVITASDATKVLEFSFMLVIRPAMVSRMTGISGRKRKNSSTTLSTVKPGRVLTTTSSHISSGKKRREQEKRGVPGVDRHVLGHVLLQQGDGGLQFFLHASTPGHRPRMALWISR